MGFVLLPRNRITDRHRDCCGAQITSRIGDLSFRQHAWSMEMYCPLQPIEQLRPVRLDDTEQRLSGFMELRQLIPWTVLGATGEVTFRFRVKHHQGAVTLPAELPVAFPYEGATQNRRN